MLIHPKVSVIMSAYNTERFIAEAIESILAQTFTDFEFLIIDDGSTDSSRDIINDYDDNRIITIVNETNLGLANSLNKGLNLARGKYIARQDADDISKPNRLERQTRYLDNHPEIAVLGSSWYLINEKGEEIGQKRVPGSPKEIAEHLLTDLVITHATVMLRKECLSATGLYRKQAGSAEDLDLWLRFSDLFRISNLWEMLYLVRVHEKSIVGSRLGIHLESLYKVRKITLGRWKKAGQAVSSPATIARCYLLLACQDFLMGRDEQGCTHLKLAVEVESSITKQSEKNSADIAQYALWTTRISSSDYNLMASSEVGRLYIERVISSFPRDWIMSPRQVYAQFMIILSFDSYSRAQYHDTIRYALSGVRQNRQWATNRGLWRIVGKSLVRSKSSLKGFNKV